MRLHFCTYILADHPLQLIRKGNYMQVSAKQIAAFESVDRCSRCVMPAKVVEQDSSGLCSLCQQDDGRINYKGESALRKLLDHHQELARRNGSKYDCIMSISGGKDSTYALYQLVRRFNMRVLCFTYRHAFAHPQAIENLQQAIKRLDLDLVINDDDSLQKRYLRHNLQSLSGLSSQKLRRSFNLICTGCNDGYARSALDLARRHKISLIVQGGCPVEPDLKFLELGVNQQRSYMGSVLRMIGRDVRVVLGSGMFYNPLYFRNVLRQLGSIKVLWNLVAARLPKKKARVSKIHFFNYLPWDEKTILEPIVNELGWRKPDSQDSTTRFDCIIHLLLDRLTSRHLGLTDKEQMYSSMIRKGLISRQEAQERLAVELDQEHDLFDSAFEQVLAELNLEDQADRLIKPFSD